MLCGSKQSNFFFWELAGRGVGKAWSHVTQTGPCILQRMTLDPDPLHLPSAGITQGLIHKSPVFFPTLLKTMVVVFWSALPILSLSAVSFSFPFMTCMFFRVRKLKSKSGELARVVY